MAGQHSAVELDVCNGKHPQPHHPPAPSGGPAWVIDPVSGDHFLGGSSSAAAVAGYPNISVPAGQVHGLPVGISFIGGRFQDARLIALAAGFERITRAFREPRFLPTLPE